MTEQSNRPRISLIVPVYNGSRYIPGLLRQFEDQSLEDIELVFVDDGSTDDSLSRLREAEETGRFPIRVCHQENRGVSAARNLGVEKARGEYIAFLDVDDGVSPDYLETLRAHAADGVEILVFSSQRVGESFTREVSPAASWEELTGEQMLARFWTDPTRLGVVNLLVKRDYLTRRGIACPEGYRYYEDYDMLLQLFAQSDSIRFLDRVLYYYILRDGSAMGRFTGERINCLKLMRQRGQWLKQTAPEFAGVFEQWGTSRLYWSVLWQAALAMPAYRDFSAFAEVTFARQYFKKLTGHPDRLVGLSAVAFLCCPPAYYLAVRLVGRRRSKVTPVTLAEILPQLDEDIRFY